MKKKLLLINLFYLSTSWAELNRIQSLRFDQGKTQSIYLTPGLGSVILFPCSLMEVFVGRSEEVKVQISPNDRKSLFLNLKKNTSSPTNMICRCVETRSIFVFDLIPSQTKHQDVVEVRSAFGRPEYAEKEKLEVKELKDSKRVVVLKEPVVVEKGGAK